MTSVSCARYKAEAGARQLGHIFTRADCEWPVLMVYYNIYTRSKVVIIKEKYMTFSSIFTFSLIFLLTDWEEHVICLSAVG